MPLIRLENNKEVAHLQRENIRFLLYLVQDFRLCLGCYNKNTLDWVTYKQQKFMSHSAGGWKIQDQSAGRFGVW